MRAYVVDVEAEAAVLLGDGRAEQAHALHPLDQFGRILSACSSSEATGRTSLRTNVRTVATSSSARAGSVRGMKCDATDPMIELGLRNDVYRRPLATALDRLGLREGWRCVDVGAGGGDVTVALAEIVGHDGRVYAVDSDPRARDEVAKAAAAGPRPGHRHHPGGRGPAPARARRPRLLPLPAACTCIDPVVVLRRMGQAVRPGGWVVAQEPITSAGRVGGRPLSMPDARHPDVGALLPALVRDAGLEIVDAWAEAPAGVGPGPVTDYLERPHRGRPRRRPRRAAPAGHGGRPPAWRVEVTGR